MKSYQELGQEIVNYYGTGGDKRGMRDIITGLDTNRCMLCVLAYLASVVKDIQKDVAIMAKSRWDKKRAAKQRRIEAREKDVKPLREKLHALMDAENDKNVRRVIRAVGRLLTTYAYDGDIEYWRRAKRFIQTPIKKWDSKEIRWLPNIGDVTVAKFRARYPL